MEVPHKIPIPVPQAGEAAELPGCKGSGGFVGARGRERCQVPLSQAARKWLSSPFLSEAAVSPPVIREGGLEGPYASAPSPPAPSLEPQSGLGPRPVFCVRPAPSRALVVVQHEKR